MAMLTALRSFTYGLRRPWPLRMEVGGLWETFANEEEYGRFLSQRLEVPAHKLEALTALDAHGVQRELRHTRRSHQNAVDILVRAMETRSRLRHLWGLVDVSKVPDEQDWPSILFAIGSADNASEPALRLTLTHYIHFLEARREILDSLSREWQAVARKGGAGRPVIPVAMRRNPQSDSEFTSRRNKVYARLPRRRAVNVDLNRRAEIAVYLARNRFSLAAVDGAVFLQSPEGMRYPMRVGRNMVGRSQQCDVCVDVGQTDVSRQHLLIELTDGNHVRLTDLSSRGTYVPPELLERMDTGDTSSRVH
ncbi:MAG TPA: FHA domain-containing protein [Gammaproteobacteria bacterium]|nr:FHA domain-containing protein [Gammaproteobacteria bacterium]